MFGSWVNFLTRTGGATVANLRRLAFQDVTAPSHLGWFVVRRIQGRSYRALCFAKIRNVCMIFSDVANSNTPCQNSILIGKRYRTLRNLRRRLFYCVNKIKHEQMCRVAPRENFPGFAVYPAPASFCRCE
jgi:hypothetical protein